MGADYYRIQIERIQTGCTFLWGPIRNALLIECRQGNLDLLYELCFIDQQLVKEMLVNVLNQLGRDNIAQVETLLRRVLPPTAPTTSLQNARQLLHPPLLTPDVRTQNAQKIAIEVASG